MVIGSWYLQPSFLVYKQNKWARGTNILMWCYSLCVTAENWVWVSALSLSTELKLFDLASQSEVSTIRELCGEIHVSKKDPSDPEGAIIVHS